MESFKDKLKYLMDSMRLNIPQFSKELGYARDVKIRRLFDDENNKPSYDIITNIAERFKVDLNWLLGKGDNVFIENNMKENRDVKYYEDIIQEKNKLIEAYREMIEMHKEALRMLESKLEKNERSHSRPQC